MDKYDKEIMELNKKLNLILRNQVKMFMILVGLTDHRYDAEKVRDEVRKILNEKDN